MVVPWTTDAFTVGGIVVLSGVLLAIGLRRDSRAGRPCRPSRCARLILTTPALPGRCHVVAAEPEAVVRPKNLGICTRSRIGRATSTTRLRWRMVES
jgi:hypothetical protein